ncbi:MAG: hypothetical protein IMW98_05215, partial [Firmicutes bacterium]|nr:hypothetical protein [Bacillota bacterium]
MRDGRTVGLPGYAACALALEDARRPGLRPAPAPGARRAVAAARAAALGLPPVGARVRVVRRASV